MTASTASSTATVHASPSESSSVVSFPTVQHIPQEVSIKLGSTNFLLWKTQIYPVLRCHGRLGFIDCTITTPTSPPDVVASWQPLDQMVLGWLLISLSDVVLSQVVDKHTARDVWLTLETLYGTQSRARVQQLKTELQSLHKGAQLVHGYIQHAKSLALALSSAGKPVADDDLVLWTLRGLGSEFDPIVAAINSRPDSPTFVDVCGLLLDYELRLSTTTALLEKSASFTVAKHPNPPRHSSTTPLVDSYSPSSNRGSYSARGTNKGCLGRRGTSTGRGKGGTGQASSSVVCYRCGYPYHKANNCWAPDKVIDSTAKAFNSMTVFNSTDPQLYVDTGATHHMAPDDMHLTAKTPYTGNDNVMVGNGTGCEDRQ